MWGSKPFSARKGSTPSFGSSSASRGLSNWNQGRGQGRGRGRGAAQAPFPIAGAALSKRKFPGAQPQSQQPQQRNKKYEPRFTSEYALDSSCFKMTAEAKQQRIARIQHIQKNLTRPALFDKQWKPWFLCTHEIEAFLPVFFHTVLYLNGAIHIFGVCENLYHQNLNPPAVKRVASLLFKVTDFRPFFFVRLVKEGETNFLMKLKGFCEGNNFSFGRDADDDVHCSFEYRRPTVGYHSATDYWKVAKLSFLTDQKRKNLLYRLREAIDPLTICHDHLTPIELFMMEILRVPPITDPKPEAFYNKKIVHEFRLCSWFRVNPSASSFSSGIRAQICLQGSIGDLTVMDENHPIFKGKADLLVMSWDIETIKHGLHRAPNATNREDLIGAMVANFHYYSTCDSLFEVWFVLGSVEDPTEARNLTPKEANILEFENEREMLTTFRKLFLEIDPDAHVTWNGSNYDWPYLLERCELHQIPTDFGRVVQQTIVSPWRKAREEGLFRKKNVSEEKESWPIHLDLVGRISLDGLPWYKKFQVNPESFSLKCISDTFLKKNLKAKEPEPALSLSMEAKVEEDSVTWLIRYLLSPFHHGKIDLPYEKISPYAVWSKHTRFALLYYCWKDARCTWEVLRETNYVDLALALLYITNVNSYDGQRLGQKIFVINRLRQHIEAGHLILNHDWNTDRPNDISGGHVPIPKPGFHICVILNDFESLYPSIMSARNLSPDSLIMNGTQESRAVDLKLPIRKIKIDKSDRVHSFVQRPDNDPPLMKAMFTVLFAERRRQKALLQKAKERDDKKAMAFHESMQLAIKNVMNSTYGFTGASSKKEVKSKQASFSFSRYVPKASAAKPKYVKRNTYYPFVDIFPIAESTTQEGRDSIKTVFERIESSGLCTYVTGDTDSTAQTFLPRFMIEVVGDLVDEWHRVQALLRDARFADLDEMLVNVRKEIALLDRRCISRLYRRAEELRLSFSKDMPLKLEVENVFFFFVMMKKKKRYFGSKINHKPGVEDEKMIFHGRAEMVGTFDIGLKIRGLECVRRDVPIFLRKTQREIIRILGVPTQLDFDFGFLGFCLYPNHEYVRARRIRTLEETSIYVQKQSVLLVSGKVDIEDLKIGRTLHSSYKGSLPAHAAVARRIAQLEGKEIEPNSKISIVRVRNGSSKENENWEEYSNVVNRRLKIDYGYYLDRFFEKPLERMLTLPGLLTQDDMKKLFQNAHEVLPRSQQANQIEKYFMPLKKVPPRLQQAK